MAEFKLGRIRFVWKEAWTSGSTYFRDDVVSFGGKIYICVIGHDAADDFFTDLDVVPSKWNLVSDGQTWKGDWQVNTRYVYDDIVRYGSRLYICNTIHTSAATTDLGLEQDESKWDVFGEGLDWRGNWTTSRRYKVNDIVKYGGTTYVCNTTHDSAATAALGLEADQAKWNAFNKGLEFLGEWQINGYRYKVNDVIQYGGGLYICTLAHSSTDDWDDTKANWQQMVRGFQYENDWKATTIYQKGDIVRWGGNHYIAVQESDGIFPTSDTDYWQIFAEGLNWKGQWGDDSALQDYRVGDVVKNNGYTYICILDHQDQEPPNSTYWNVLNAGVEWRGQWGDDVEYKLGDLVRYGANTYICVQRHLSEGDDGSTQIPQVSGAANSRPDQDNAGAYWNIFAVGSETSVLTSVGDLVYYGGAGPTRLPVGQEGTILTVNDDLVPEWAFLGVSDDVYYVSPKGTDAAAPRYGLTIDRPWKTIRFAAEQVEKGTKAPNAARLLRLNRQFIQREIVEYIEYQINDVTNVNVDATSIWYQFEYSAEKCYRDMGFLVDAFVWDITHGGNVKSREAALSYVNETTGSPYLTQKEQTVAAIQYGLTVIEKVLKQEAPDTIYQVANGDNSTAIVEQYFELALGRQDNVEYSGQVSGGTTGGFYSSGTGGSGGAGQTPGSGGGY